MALGMVMQLPDQDDETSVSRRQLLAKLDVCMGGRVAEELIFGESNITTGTHIPQHSAARQAVYAAVWASCSCHYCVPTPAFARLGPAVQAAFTAPEESCAQTVL